MRTRENQSTRWRAALGQALIAVATLVLLMEFGEFAVLTYVWAFATEAKDASRFDSVIILATAVVTMSATLLLSIASLISISRRRAWPTSRFFSAFATFVAATQVIFLLFGTVTFEGDWLNDFFQSKAPSFAAGVVCALALAVVHIFVRPWGTSSKIAL